MYSGKKYDGAKLLVAHGKSLDLDGPPRIMGVLNLTPDSFYEGSRCQDVGQALERAHEMVEEGADVVDVGGESTRPGAIPVSAREEMCRVLPVIAGLAESLPGAIISIDTYKSEVAREAVAAGAHMINDVSAGLLDRQMLSTVAELEAGFVMMHMRGEPRTMQLDTGYEDIFTEIDLFFQNGLERASRVDLEHERVVLDPGIGFGKSPEDSVELICRLSDFFSLGRPLMVGPSRKSFMALAGLKTSGERLEGTLAACTVAALAGVNILRVHDVGPVRRAVAVAFLCLQHQARVSLTRDC